MAAGKGGGGGKAYKAVVKLDVGKEEVFCGAFNTVDPRYLDMFACVSGNKMMVYQCRAGGETEFVKTYLDEEKDHVYYTIVWATTREGVPLLAASGSKGTIRVIDCIREDLMHTLVGHGGSVNELTTHPKLPFLVLSCSKDESLRLWNVVTGVCVLILGGARGHRNEVLSADFHQTDGAIVASCGMDGSVRVWSLHEYWHVVEDSCMYQQGSPTTFPTKIVQYPLFTVRNVHTNYVDCIRWYGDFILSKSVDNKVVLWRWCLKSQSNSHTNGVADILQSYDLPSCDIWFIKFSVDRNCNLLAAGNMEGKVYVWDLNMCPPKTVAELSNKGCKAVVRQIALSHDGSILMSCCGDGKVWRWDRQRKDSAAAASSSSLPPLPQNRMEKGSSG